MGEADAEATELHAFVFVRFANEQLRSGTYDEPKECT